MTTSRGVASAVLAAALFGAVFYLSGTVVEPAELVVGWRIMITFGCYLLVLLHPRPRALFRESWSALTRTAWMPLIFLSLTLIVGFQLWLFSWAPQNDHALDASLGFLLLPLSTVVGGRVLLGSALTRAQLTAVMVAVVAIAIQFTVTPRMSWVTVAIAVGYPGYFVLRRRFGLDGPMAFGWEVGGLSVPAAVLLIVSDPGPHSHANFIWLALLGLAGAAAMAAYLAAASLLPLPLFGMLGYLEPVGLVAVALLLGERLTGAGPVVYGLLALALALLVVDALLPDSGSGARRRRTWAR